MTTNTEQNADIGIEELATLKNIIEIACSRGAFKADEMLAVGSVYTRLSTFLDNVIAEAQAQQMAHNHHSHESDTNKGESQ